MDDVCFDNDLSQLVCGGVLDIGIDIVFEAEIFQGFIT